MATMEMRFTLSTGANLLQTVNLTDGNATRIINAYREIYEMPPASTAAQVWARVVNGVFNELKSNTMARELQDQQPAISDIPLT